MEIIYFKKQSDLRKWFKKNHNKLDEVWIGYYKKKSGKKGITYHQSLDEALCFGWIDGIRKSIDEESYTSRFTPRRKKSNWSAVNIKRIKELIKLGLAEPSGLEAFSRVNTTNTNRYSFEQEKLLLPKEYEKLIRENKKAWEYFSKLPPSVKKPSVWYIMSAKKEETRLKRVRQLINCSEAGERLPQFKISSK